MAGRHGAHRPGGGSGHGKGRERWPGPRTRRARGRWARRRARGLPGSEPAGDARPQGLAGRAARAVGWSFTSSALCKLGTVGIGILLARLLGPHAFGTYAVAYVALRVLVNLNDLGVSLAIVRWPGDPREIAPTVSTIALATSGLMYAGCYLGAPGYAAAMGAPAATGVVRVLCLVVIVDGLVAGPAGLLQRQFRQDLRLITDQVNVWIGAILTVALALAGLGAMSLAAGRLAGCLAALALLVKFSPQPLRFGFRPAAARQLLRFGLPLAGSAVITFAVVNADQFIVGRLLGVTALGYFVLAANLSSWPVTMFSQPVRNVAPAAFARLQHDPPAMRRAFVSVAGLLGAVALPVCLTISGLAGPLVGLVYGERWLPAAPALAWLAALAALQIAFELSYDFFVVLAMSRVVFTLQLVWLAVLIPALVAGALTGGMAGTARAEIVVAAGLALPWYLRELRKAGIRGRALADRLWLPVAGAALAGLACLAASRFIPGHLAALAAGGTVSALVVWLLLYRLRADLAVLLRRPRGRSGRAAPSVAPGAGGRAPAVASMTDLAGPAALEPRPTPALMPDGPAATGRDPGAGWRAPDAATPPAAWPGLPPRADATGPLPLCRDLPGMEVPPPGAGWRPPGPSGGGLPPLYRATARRLGWEPQMWRAPAQPGDCGRSGGGWDPGEWGLPDRGGRHGYEAGAGDWLPDDWHPDRWEPGTPEGRPSL